MASTSPLSAIVERMAEVSKKKGLRKPVYKEPKPTNAGPPKRRKPKENN